MKWRYEFAVLLQAVACSRMQCCSDMYPKKIFCSYCVQGLVGLVGIPRTSVNAQRKIQLRIGLLRKIFVNIIFWHRINIMNLKIRFKCSHIITLNIHSQVLYKQKWGPVFSFRKLSIIVYLTIIQSLFFRYNKHLCAMLRQHRLMNEVN